jgi:hypothetical protein
MVCRLALKYQLQCHKSKLTPEETQVIENKQGHLQTLIDKFEWQADSFILHYQSMEIPKISPISDYNQYDNYGDMNNPPVVGVMQGSHSKTKANARVPMIHGWITPILQAFPYFSHPHLDGTGVLTMVLKILLLRKQSSDLHNLMNLFTRFVWP